MGVISQCRDVFRAALDFDVYKWVKALTQLDPHPHFARHFLSVYLRAARPFREEKRGRFRRCHRRHRRRCRRRCRRRRRKNDGSLF